MKRFNIIVSFILSVILLTSCVTQGEQELSNQLYSPTVAIEKQEHYTDTVPENSTLEVHYIDVGQADAALLQCGDNTMLIDGGNVADSSLIVAYLKKLNIEHIDYMVCTHAHEDHVGGLSAPLSVMPVGAIYAPSAESDSKAYQTFKQKAAAQNSEIMHPINYERFPLGSATVEILAAPDNADNLNNTSIVLKITHGNNSFLFMGDAEREEEQILLNTGLLKSDVLKVGHHGSDTSTSYVFLREVMPEYAVISVGKDNSYGHPSEAVLSRLRDADVKVYRTDLQGDIIAKSNGSNITITTEKNENIQTNETTAAPMESGYIGNKNSKKFHRPDCRTLPAEKNRVPFSSREAAINSGYSPCGNCMP
ncbi:MAG: MBL fold metallo-hydrolase [bacterium]|nr:MBL fold metallo-hydrolase [bacterium]